MWLGGSGGRLRVNGKAHALASLSAAIPSGLIGAAMGGPVVGLGMAAGCLIGVLLTCDIDQIDDGTIHTAEKWFIRYVPVLGYLWLALWDPYARCVRHRNLLSHFPLLATGGRVGYVYLWLRVFKLSWPLPPELTIGMIAGLTISDILHWVMDGGPVRFKWGRKKIDVRCLQFLLPSVSGSRA